MKKYIIKTGTVTYAIKGKDVLKRNGISAKVERITNVKEALGCGYAIVIEDDITKAETLLKNAGVKILEISSK